MKTLGWVATHLGVFLVGALLVAVFLLHADNARLQNQIQQVKATTVQVVPPSVFVNPVAQTPQGIVTHPFQGVTETVHLVPEGPTSVVERTVSRPTVSASAPGGSSAPETPLIPVPQQPAARQVATETEVVHFDPGHLVDCGLPDQIELLRDPSGALSSTAPCVNAVDDTVRVPTPTVSVPVAGEPNRLNLVAGVGGRGSLGIGLAYEAVRVSRWSLNAAALYVAASPSYGPGVAAGAGIAYHFDQSFSVGAYVLYDGTTGNVEPWLLAGLRF